MTHTKPMAEHEGELNSGMSVPDTACRKCGEKGHVRMQTWESSDGAYEDYKFTCDDCGHVWWIDGIDS